MKLLREIGTRELDIDSKPEKSLLLTRSSCFILILLSYFNTPLKICGDTKRNNS